MDVAYSLEGADLEELAALGFTVPSFNPPYLWYLVFNLRDPLIADLRVRQAIAYAIDRESLCAELFPGRLFRRIVRYLQAPLLMTRMQQIAMSTIPSGQGSSWPRQGQTMAWFWMSLRRKRVCAARSGAIYQRLALDLAKVGIRLNVTLHPDWVAYCNQWREGAPSGIAFSEMSWGCRAIYGYHRSYMGQISLPEVSTLGITMTLISTDSWISLVLRLTRREEPRYTGQLMQGSWNHSRFFPCSRPVEV